MDRIPAVSNLELKKLDEAIGYEIDLAEGITRIRVKIERGV